MGMGGKKGEMKTWDAAARGHLYWVFTQTSSQPSFIAHKCNKYHISKLV